MDNFIATPEIRETLERARALISAGNAGQAMPLALEVLDHALESGDFRLQGEAMHCMAVSELRLLGRFDRALELSERAAICQQRVGNDAGESTALATHAIAAVRLGRHERAMESALLAVRLAESVGDPARLVLTYHALGVAAYSGRNFAESRNAYQRAIRFAGEAIPPLNVFELQVDLAFTEGLQYFTERNLGGNRLSLDAMTRHLAECRRLQTADGGNISLSPGSHVNNLVVLGLSATLLPTWLGNLAEAERALAEFRATEGADRRPWMMATTHWAEAEIALVRNDHAAARRHAQALTDISLAHGHATLTSIGYQLLSFVCHSQGEHVDALRALQQLLKREQTARAESLQSRVEVIEWQLDLRRQEQRVQRLETDSRLFEKLAMEDALTGLPNRRRLESELKAWLDVQGNIGEPLCVALIDVDRFKDVNDRHSHNVGDAVLKRIAQIFREGLRDHDFPARLAGDEFVIVLRNTSVAAARDICARLGDATRTFDWSSIADGLSATISIGLAQSRPGDTVEEMLARSDAAMYSEKAARRPAVAR